MMRRLVGVAAGLVVAGLVVSLAPVNSEPAQAAGLDGPPVAAAVQLRPGTAKPGVGVSLEMVAARPDGQPRTARVAAAAPEAKVPSVGGVDGDFSAAKLSASGSWNGGSATGGFSYGYPLRAPGVVGGLVPQLGLSYSSQTVDGVTGGTNHQASHVGEGWSFGAGAVQRRYVPCAQDLGGNNKQRKTGDLCWLSDNALLSYGGVTTELVKVSDSKWRLQSDTGAVMERLRGGYANGDADKEYWRLTQPDGTRVFFGRGRATKGSAATKSVWTVPVVGNHAGEPGYKAGDFAGSRTVQAWQWNVDYVVDVHGNSMTFFYGTDTNRYGFNLGATAVSYVRDGWLSKVEYGQRAGTEHTSAAAARIVFDMGQRCEASGGCPVVDAGHAKAWPDVPVKAACPSGACTKPEQFSPAFYSTRKLVRVRSFSGGSEVERWDLSHRFADPGDGSVKGLWLRSITHTSADGAHSDPATVFAGMAFPNRVEPVDVTGDVYPNRLHKYRMTAIKTATGGQIAVQYANQECMRGKLPGNEATNNRRCFPVWWTPTGGDPVKDWFHTYVVEHVSQTDAFGNAGTQTHYTYSGGAGWGYTDQAWVPAKYRAWSQWLGYPKVTTTVGEGAAALKTETLVYRGRHGQGPPGKTVTARVTDSTGVTSVDAFALRGRVREQSVFNGATRVSSTITDYDASRVTAGMGAKAARIVVATTATTRKAAEAGEAVTTRVSTSHDQYGYPIKVHDAGDVSTTADDVCTTTSYAHATSPRLLLGRAKTVETQKGACSSWSATAKPGVTQQLVRTYYDGNTALGAIGKGDATKVEVATRFDGNTPVYATTTTTVDRFGRSVSVTDPLQRTTTTRFTPAEGYRVTGITETSPDPDGGGSQTALTTTLELDPTWGTPIKLAEPDGKTTEATIDYYGRITQVWAPGFTKTKDDPSSRFEYHLSNTPNNGWNAVTTRKRLPDSTAYLTSVQLMDGWLRPVQTQATARSDYTDDNGHPKWTMGRLVSNIDYDSRGLQVASRGPIYATGDPSTTLAFFNGHDFPRGTATHYDGAGRTTRVDRLGAGAEVRATTAHTYGGDRATVTPPVGTPTTTIHDARGNMVSHMQHHAAPQTGGDTHTYTWTPTGRLASMKDPRGITWRYGYDLAGNRVKTIDPDTGTSTSVYDLAGQLTSTTDSRNTTLTHTYDALGRKTGVTHNGKPRMSWSYNTKGQPATITRHLDGHPITTTFKTYDNAGRLKHSITKIPAIDGWIPSELAGDYQNRFGYTNTGELDYTIQYNPGPLGTERVIHNRDPLGRPNSIRGYQFYATGTLYDPLNQPTRYRTGDTLTSPSWTLTQHHSETGLVERELTQRNKQPEPDVAVTYLRDKGLRITGIDTTTSGQGRDTQCFTYDHRNRMTQAWTPANHKCGTTPGKIGGASPYRLSWAFDASNNRTSETNHHTGTTTSWAHPEGNQPRPHAPTSQTVTTGGKNTTSSFAYDKRGNTTGRTATTGAITPASPAVTTTIGYDAENRPDTITHTNGKVTKVAYSAGGDELIHTDGTTTTLYLGDTHYTWNQAQGEHTVQRTYSFLGRPVAQRIKTNKDNTRRGVVHTMWTDHHHTGTAQTNQTTNTTTFRPTRPYGTPRTTKTDWIGDSGFLGKTNQPQHGWTHIGDRNYDPATGRFLQPDRLIDIADPNTWNPYTYSNHNPINLSDPTGLAHDPTGFTPHGAAPGGHIYNGRGQVIHKGRAPSTAAPSIGGSQPGLAPGKIITWDQLSSHSSHGAVQYLDSSVVQFTPEQQRQRNSYTAGFFSLAISVGVGCLTRNPFAVGAAGGASYYALNTWMNGDPWSWEELGVHTGVGAVLSFAGKLATSTVIRHGGSLLSKLKGTPAPGAANTGSSPYEVAVSGGRHSGFFKNYAERPTPEIQRGISSIEKQIAEHQAKIRNPAAYIEDWATLDPRQQQALLTSKWPGDIARQQEQLAILRGILEKR